MLTHENYFSKENSIKYMGSSQFKSFMRCEAATLAEIKGDWNPIKPKAFLEGSFVDAHFEGNMGLFQAQHPEMFTKKGELYSNFRNLENVISRMESDKIFLKHCTGEQQKIMTGKISGIDFKIMIDSFLPDMTVDRKCMRDFSDIYNTETFEFEPWWKVYGYDIQAYIYQTIRSQNENGIIKPFVLAAVTKENIPDLGLFKFTEETIYNAKVLVDNFAARFDAIKRGIIRPNYCGKCDYCKSIRKMEQNKYIEI